MVSWPMLKRKGDIVAKLKLVELTKKLKLVKVKVKVNVFQLLNKHHKIVDK